MHCTLKCNILSRAAESIDTYTSHIFLQAYLTLPLVRCTRLCCPTFSWQFSPLAAAHSDTSMDPTTNDAVSKGQTAGKASVRTKKKRPAKKGKKALNKPKRPLCAYNFFFQYERDLMLRNMPSKSSLDHNQHHMTLHKSTSIRKSNNKSSRPPPHGKIRFAQLAKIIGPKWKTIDPQRRKHFEALAATDMKRYKSECQKYKLRINAKAEQQRQQQQQQHPLPVKETSVKSAAGAMVGAAAGDATSSMPEHNSRVLPNEEPTRMSRTYNILTEACKIDAFPSVENNTPSMQCASLMNTVLLPQAPQLATSCQSSHHPTPSQRADAALPKAKLRNPTTPVNGTKLPTATCLSPLATVPTATCLSPLATVPTATVRDCLSPSSVETTSTNASSWLSPSSITESTNDDAAGHDKVHVTDTDMLNLLEIVIDATDVPTCTSRLTTPVPDDDPSAYNQDSPAHQRYNNMSTYGMLDQAVNIANLTHQDTGVSGCHPEGLSSPSASSAKMPSVQHPHVQESSVDVSMDSFVQDIFADYFDALEDPEMQEIFDLV